VKCVIFRLHSPNCPEWYQNFETECVLDGATNQHRLIDSQLDQCSDCCGHAHRRRGTAQA